MPILDVLQNIYTIGKLIYDHAQVVQANKAQCQRLSDRISIIITSVKSLETVKDSDHYREGLLDLHNNLQECLSFIQEFSNQQGWFKKILKAGSNEKKFIQLNEALVKSVQTLSLGISAQQIINREQDSKDRAADTEYIRKNQDHIIGLNMKTLDLLDEIKISQEDQKAIMGNALQSMRGHIMALQSPAAEAKQAIPSELIIPYYYLEFREKIEEGSCGQVFRGQWAEQTVAIKTIRSLDEKAMEEFNREVAIMSRLRHENIVSLYAACMEKEHPCLVMEYMNKGSLLKTLENVKLTEDQQKQIALDIAKGLFYLHQQKVLHRDLKSGNILLNAHGQAKITGFGLSKTKSHCIKTIKKETPNIEWQAPEALRRGYSYEESADIYSYGMILWEIVTSKRPFAEYKEDHLPVILSGRQEEIPNTVPAVYRRLIESCWNPNPKKRPDLKTIIHELTAYIPVPQISPEEYYERGIQLEKEKKFSQAREQYEQAAKQGYARAMTNIGHFFFCGLGGLKQNKAKAYENLLAAAKKGHVRAMANLAKMLETGDGIVRDPKEALKWYESAAKAGDIEAQTKCDELKKTSTESEKKATALTVAPENPFKGPATPKTVLDLRQPQVQTKQNEVKKANTAISAASTSSSSYEAITIRMVLAPLKTQLAKREEVETTSTKDDKKAVITSLVPASNSLAGATTVKTVKALEPLKTQSAKRDRAKEISAKDEQKAVATSLGPVSGSPQGAIATQHEYRI